MRRLFTIILFSISSLAYSAEFRWAADLASGVPSVFMSQDDPEEIIGFEKDFVDALAKEMHLDPVFINNEWDGLIPGLLRGTYDAVINTLEITEDKKEVIDFSDPYFITSEQLVVNADNTTISSIDDLTNHHVIGTLKNSRAADILEARGNLNVRLYSTELRFLQDLANGRIDGVLIDAPIAVYYSAINDHLKLVGGPVGKITFGIGVRKGNKALLSKINSAIHNLKTSGKLRKILDSWNLWNTETANYFHDFAPRTIEPYNYNAFIDSFHESTGTSLTDDLKKYISFLPLLAKGALITLELSVCAMFLAIALGFLLAMMRIYGPKPIIWLAKMYIEIMRGTPLLIQLYFIFYGLPTIGIKFDPFMAGFIALGLNYAAYEAENYRAGILSIPDSQMEAARALGMTHWQGLRYIIIPQAFRVMIPPMTNDFISLLKDSSLVSVITIVELTFAYNLLATTYYNYFGIGIMVAIIYLILGLPFVKLSRWAEDRLSIDRKKRSK